jgi:hypothetical protein
LSGSALGHFLPGLYFLLLGAGLAAALGLAGCLLTAFAVVLGCAWWVPAPAGAPVLSWKGDGR